MGKNRTQKPSVMREAANKRAEYRKWLVRLVVGSSYASPPLARTISWSLTTSSRTRRALPGFSAAIAAIFLGWFGNKFSKTHRAYTGYLAERGLTNEDVVEFLKTNGRDNPRA